MSEKPDAEGYLLDAILRLEARYPALLRRLSTTGSSIEIHFYHEEIAWECASALTQAGIAASHSTQLRVVSLPLAPLIASAQVTLAEHALEAFLQDLDQRCHKNSLPYPSDDG